MNSLKHFSQLLIRFPLSRFLAVLLAPLVLASGAVAAAAPTDYLPAFPGAQGAGAKTSGGRGGRVIAVTNLDDAGEGSLRAAIEASGPRTIVFRVAGTIALQSRLVIKNGDLTLAGQSAPGGGICLKNQSLVISASNVIVRHLRVRLGDEGKGQGDSITVWRGVHGVILDHCSATWSEDEALSLSGDVADVTVQWCLIGEALRLSNHTKGAHAYGSLMRAAGPVSLHHNLWAHNDSRNPRLGDNYGQAPFPTFDVRNNVIYDYGGTASGQTQGVFGVNYVGNFIKSGPSSRAKTPITIGGPSQIRLFLSGNEWENRPDFTRDNSKFPSRLEVDGKPAVELLKAPVEMPLVQTTTARGAFDAVLNGVGATQPRRDVVDARIVNDAREGTGKIIDSQSEVGGWPALENAPAPADSDGDGMPDGWERANGFKLDDAKDGALDADGDGYTNLEEYLNATEPRVWVDYKEPKNNVDAMSHFNLQKDIIYSEIEGEILRLDAYVPNGEGPFPVAIVLHGGGWSGGDKDGDTLPICRALAQSGFVIFTPNYRLAPAHRWPAAAQDVASALDWAKTHAADYGGDAARLALVGYSAGGQLACFAATERNHAAQAVVLFSAPVDLVADTRRRGELSPSMRDLIGADEISPAVEERLAAMSPLNFVGVDLPPFLLLHGTDDKSVLYDQSLALRDKLRAANVPCELITLEGAPHRLADWPQFDANYARKMTDWLHQILSSKR